MRLGEVGIGFVIRHRSNVKALGRVHVHSKSKRYILIFHIAKWNCSMRKRACEYMDDMPLSSSPVPRCRTRLMSNTIVFVHVELCRLLNQADEAHCCCTRCCTRCCTCCCTRCFTLLLHTLPHGLMLSAAVHARRLLNQADEAHRCQAKFRDNPKRHGDMSPEWVSVCSGGFPTFRA
jgi:hypothetical protein